MKTNGTGGYTPKDVNYTLKANVTPEVCCKRTKR